MEDSGKLSRHFWQTQGMARAVGVNLNSALKSGQLRRRDYAQTIAECCNCAHYQPCLSWLARNGAEATRPPAFCALSDLLEELRQI